MRELLITEQDSRFPDNDKGPEMRVHSNVWYKMEGRYLWVGKKGGAEQKAATGHQAEELGVVWRISQDANPYKFGYQSVKKCNFTYV